jgi:hypothetical protein
MLPETAYIKLSWLLEIILKKKQKTTSSKNLRGEITERSLYEKEFCE